MENAYELMTIVADEYGVSVAEIMSQFRYDPLPEARQLLCKSMFDAGLRNVDICRAMQYKPGYVHYCIKAANKRDNSFFNLRVGSCVKFIKESQWKT